MVVARPVPVYRHTLALERIRELVDRPDILDRRRVREVGRLGDPAVAVGLKRRLHLHVPLGLDGVRGHEHLLPFRRHLREIDTPLGRDPLHQRVGVPPLAFRDGDEILVHVGHHDARLVAHERHREQRLEPRRAPRDDRDRPRRRHRRDVAVPQELHRPDPLARGVTRARLVRSPDRPRPLGEGAPLVRQPLTLTLPFRIHERHDFAPEFDALGRIVREPESHERVREPHHTQPDPSDPLGERVDLDQRIPVDVDDVVEEVRREMNVASERGPIHLPLGHVMPDVDATQIADIIREQWLLAARIRRLV